MMLNKRLVALLVVPVFVCAFVSGWMVKDAQADDLAAVLAEVYRSNPQLETARADLRATDELVPIARSGWLPTITGEVTTGRSQRSGQTFLFQDQSTTPRNYSLRGVQPLYSGGTTYNQMTRSRHLVDAARHDLRQAEQEIFRRAIAAYLDVRRDRAVLDLNINNEKVLIQQLQAAKDRFEVGEVTLTDVSQAHARLAEATAAKIFQQGVLQDSIAGYVAIVGMRPPDVLRQPSLPPLPPDLATVVERALDGYPAVLSARSRVSAAESLVSQLSGGFAPRLTLEGSVSRSVAQSTPTSRVDRMDIMARLQVPLYQAGLVSAQVREAKQQLSGVRSSLVSEKRNGRERAASAWQNLKRSRAQSVSFRAQIEANTIALEGVNEEAKVGNRTVLDILNAENELFESRTSLVRSQHDDIFAAFDVLFAMGNLTAIDLKLDVEYYDPQRYARSVEWKIWGTSTGD